MSHVHTICVLRVRISWKLHVAVKTRHDGEFTVAQYSNEDHLMMIFDEKYMNTDNRLKIIYLECFIMHLIHIIDKGMGALKLFFFNFR